MYLIKPSFQILNIAGGIGDLELCGRVCYKSEDRITLKSAEKFVKGILKNQHLSVIEHSSLTVKFVIDRGVSHELVRHRLASFSQESTRYCNYGKQGVTFVIPPWFDIEPGEYPHHTLFKTKQAQWWFDVLHHAECVYTGLLQEGQTPQQARSVLPNSLKTEIIMTANFREWKHVFDLRCSEKAHPQMREVMVPLLDTMRERIPIIFD